MLFLRRVIIIYSYHIIYIRICIFIFIFISYPHSGSQSAVPSPAASAAPGNLSEIHTRAPDLLCQKCWGRLSSQCLHKTRPPPPPQGLLQILMQALWSNRQSMTDLFYATEQGCQTHFHRGPHQPHRCPQRAECRAPCP